MSELIYTVRITDCSEPSILWYRDLVGEDLECRLILNKTITWPGDQIFETVNDLFRLPYGELPAKPGYIRADDCKILFTLKPEA